MIFKKVDKGQKSRKIMLRAGLRQCMTADWEVNNMRNPNYNQHYYLNYDPDGVSGKVSTPAWMYIAIAASMIIITKIITLL